MAPKAGDDSEEYVDKRRKTRTRQPSNQANKRRKTSLNTHTVVTNQENEEKNNLSVSFELLNDALEDIETEEYEDCSFAYDFAELVDPMLQNFAQDRDVILADASHNDGESSLRRMTRAEVVFFEESLSKDLIGLGGQEAVTLRKLKLERQRRRANVTFVRHNHTAESGLFVNQDVIRHRKSEEKGKDKDESENQDIMDRLSVLRTTPYDNTFSWRLYGPISTESSVISVDWETKTPWMELMEDIREHHELSHPEEQLPEYIRAAITYVTLRKEHLDQVHDLLERSFWNGITVTDSLDYSPERCTVVALYKKLVVGVAILSSPRETYITYLSVKAGWDGKSIATRMLYHLIMMSPGKDITLHVSANNPAMLLYNRFGFKAEEFVTGFYDAYLDPSSLASKNAIRLRLRQI